jgi:Sulfotransferase family
MTRPEAPVTIMHITGLGRSGSTILDIVLGTHPQIQSVGEVGNLVRTGWISRESLRGIPRRKLRIPLCTCGKSLDVPNGGNGVELCPFWSSVRREWVERAGQDNIEPYPRLQDTFERLRRWPHLLRENHKPSPQFESYARLTRALFESVHAVSGKPIIVDSSKSPVRAFSLGMIPGIDLRLVHLIRDGRGVMVSRGKSFQMNLQAGVEWDHEAQPVWKSGVHWVVLNLVAEWVCAQLGPERTIQIRYEDFVDDPKNTLDRIGSLLGLDLRDVANAASLGKALEVGHNVGGNRVRKSEKVSLQPDAREWRDTLSAREQRLTWLFLGWLMRRYGYKREYLAS